MGHGMMDYGSMSTAGYLCWVIFKFVMFVVGAFLFSYIFWKTKNFVGKK